MYTHAGRLLPDFSDDDAHVHMTMDCAAVSAGPGQPRQQLPGEGIGGARGLALKRKVAKEKDKTRGGKKRKSDGKSAEVRSPALQRRRKHASGRRQTFKDEQHF